MSECPGNPQGHVYKSIGVNTYECVYCFLKKVFAEMTKGWS
jgi:hypothetical protein